MKSVLRSLGFFILLLCSSLQSLQAAQLNESDIENWLKLAPKMQLLFETHQSTLAHTRLNFKQGVPQDVGAKAKAYLQQANLLSTFESALDNKFTVEEYISVQTQIIQALMEHAKAQSPSLVERQLAENILDLEEVEGLSAEQKMMLRQQMESLFNVSQQQKTSLSPNAKLIAKYQKRIQQVLAQHD